MTRQQKRAQERKNAKQRLPFRDLTVIDTTSQWIENPRTGKKVLLTPTEIAVYEFIKGFSVAGFMFCDSTYLEKSVMWFKQNNTVALYDLVLDLLQDLETNVHNWNPTFS